MKTQEVLLIILAIGFVVSLYSIYTTTTSAVPPILHQELQRQLRDQQSRIDRLVRQVADHNKKNDTFQQSNTPIASENNAFRALEEKIEKLTNRQDELLNQIHNLENERPHLPKTEHVTEPDSLLLDPRTTTIPEDLSMTYQSNGTIVTAYFEIRSKHKKKDYQEWMGYMLSIDDPVILFTTPDWVDIMWELRSHARNRTVIIPTKLEDLPLATDFETALWEQQFKKDPIAKTRKGFQLYWIWLSKTHFVNEAIKLNPFQSTHFMWSDIGCHRTGPAFANKTIMTHLEMIPNDSVLFMSYEPPKLPNGTFPKSLRDGFFTSGSSFAGTKETLVSYHKLFVQTIHGYLDRGLFIGEDQAILQTTCLHNEICEWVLVKQVKPSDTSYFALRTVLHYGGKHYQYWKAPAGWASVNKN